MKILRDMSSRIIAATKEMLKIWLKTQVVTKQPPKTKNQNHQHSTSKKVSPLTKSRMVKLKMNMKVMEIKMMAVRIQWMLMSLSLRNHMWRREREKDHASLLLGVTPATKTENRFTHAYPVHSEIALG